MITLYNFLIGIGVWIAFSIFIGGLVIKAIFFYGISRERDKLIYHHFKPNLSWPMRSILHWLIPLGSISLRQQPLFSTIVFIFHICLLSIPIFLLAHNTLWEESIGIKIPSMPDILANWLTLVVIFCISFLFARRIIRPEVRAISEVWDYILLFLVLAPFLTGYLAYNQWWNYEVMIILHMIFSEILLILIPFSKLSHTILFFFTRGFIGQEMGSRREMENRLGAHTW